MPGVLTNGSVLPELASQTIRPRPIGRASGVIHEGSVPRDVERVPSVTTVPGALYNLPHAQLCPGNDALQKLQQQFR